MSDLWAAEGVIYAVTMWSVPASSWTVNDDTSRRAAALQQGDRRAYVLTLLHRSDTGVHLQEVQLPPLKPPQPRYRKNPGSIWSFCLRTAPQRLWQLGQSSERSISSTNEDADKSHPPRVFLLHSCKKHCSLSNRSWIYLHLFDSSANYGGKVIFCWSGSKSTMGFQSAAVCLH